VTKRSAGKAVFDRCTFASRVFERDLWISVDGSDRIFTTLAPTFNFRFPRHFFFANFQCLRCGKCCRHYMPVKVHSSEIRKWTNRFRRDILEHVWCFRKRGYCTERVSEDSCVDCEHSAKYIEPESVDKGCPFLRRVRGVLLRIRLVPISCPLVGFLRHDGVVFAHLLASGTCMEASWISMLIGLHAGSVMGVG